MKRIGAVLAGVVMASVVLLWALPAWSCMDSSATFQLDGASVPSTVAGAMFRNCENQVPDEAPQFALFDDSSGDEIPVSAERRRHGLFEVRFEEALSEDRTYRFEADPECPTEDFEGAASWYFDTTEAAEIPEDPGVWLPSSPSFGTIRYPDPDVCTREAEAAYINFEFVPNEEGETWGEAIAFETLVNQDVWEPQFGVGETVPSGASRWGWGDEQVYVVCEDEKPEPQPHAEVLDRWVNIEFEVWIPGTDVFWRSDNKSLILNCPNTDEEDDAEEQEDEEKEQLDEADEDEDRDEEDQEEEGMIVPDEESSCSQVSRGTAPLTLFFFVLAAALLRRRK